FQSFTRCFITRTRVESNFERLIGLAEEVFAFRNDPDQLNINPAILERLQQIHPYTISQFEDTNGPVAWVLVIPTTEEIMHLFLREEITEKQLFEMTPLNTKYDALYLCSALVLEEYRRKGITMRLVLK